MWPVLYKGTDLIIYSYPLFMGMSWGLSYQLTRGILESKGISLKGFQFLFWGIFLNSWVGAKVFYLITSGKTDLTTNSSFWLGGGFVFYGGFLFSLIFVLLYCLVFKKFKLSDLAYLSPGLAFGHALGRIGCLLAGCCFGTTCSLPWAIHLHDEWRHPVQAYEALGLVFIGFFILKLIRKNTPGVQVVLSYIGSYSLLRFSLEFIRGDKIRGVYYGLSTSQWVSLVLIMTLLIVLIRNRIKNT